MSGPLGTETNSPVIDEGTTALVQSQPPGILRARVEALPDATLVFRARIEWTPPPQPPAGSSAGGGTATTYEEVAASALSRIMTHAGPRAARYVAPINQTMREFGINTPRRQAAFLAQIAHESGELRYMQEIATGAEYEGRRGNLGNTHPGDGRRYKGRGPIQLTGRANYRRVGHALGIDLENHPELAANPDVGFRIAGYFWRAHGLNQLADQGNFREITRRINGGYTHEVERERYYQRALHVLEERQGARSEPGVPGQTS